MLPFEFLRNDLYRLTDCGLIEGISILKAVFSRLRTYFLFALVLSLTVGFSAASMVEAEPVDDAMKICTRLADDTPKRVKEFEALGWRTVTALDGAARALADANALTRLPSENTQEAWAANLAAQETLKEHLNWPHILEVGDSFVFLGGLAPTNPTDFSTCTMVTSASPRGADIFSEAEALGTLEYNSGVYHGRISRTTFDGEGKGWITVVIVAAVGPDAAMPRKVSSSLKMTFVNGRLRD